MAKVIKVVILSEAKDPMQSRGFGAQRGMTSASKLSFRHLNSRGFTLIESLLAIVIISAVVVAVAHIMIIALNSYSLIVERREALGEARLAVNMITNELQTIANPAADITNISPTSITFLSAEGAAVTYSIVGGVLNRNADALAANVTDDSGFTCYGANGVVLVNQAALVHRIHVTIGVDTGIAGQGIVTINDNVYLRNRYYDGFTQM